MKRILSVVLLSGFAVFLLSSIAVAQQTPPPPPPKAPKTEKHIKMIKVDDQGKKMVLDTVLTNNEPFVWNGDTIGGGKELKWISKEGFKLDSVHQNFDTKFDYNIEDDGKGNMVIMKSGKGGKHMIMVPDVPGMPMPPPAPGVMMLRNHNKKNVIDLSDPGIISYDKKLRKDGTEKITIVRKQVNDDEAEMMEDVMINAPHGSDAFFYGNSPKHVKTVKVIKSDDGTFNVYQNDKVIRIEDINGEATFTGDDGEVIHIKEIKEDDASKVEVKVEKKEEKKNK
jgi:hypothetical protein